MGSIDASTATLLRVDCRSDFACRDIKLRCPPHRIDAEWICPPNELCYRNESIVAQCIVNGTVNGGDSATVQRSHQRLTIYATHSWRDVHFVDYWAEMEGTESRMLCGRGANLSECVIASAWRCADAESPCFVGDDNLP